MTSMLAGHASVLWHMRACKAHDSQQTHVCAAALQSSRRAVRQANDRRCQRDGRRQHSGRCCSTAEDPPPDEPAQDPSETPKKALSGIIRRKHTQIKARIEEMGIEALESQLQTAATTQRQGQDFRLTRLISEVREREGRPAMVVEMRRGPAVATPSQLAAAAAAAVAAGADTVAICTDAEATPQGLADLFAVCRGVPQPVVARDWYLHPIQVVDAREAGAASILGIVDSVTGAGSAVLSSFASALGMEAPVEVVNKQQSDAAEGAGIPFVAINVGVQLSLGMPSIAAQISDALIKDQPFGNLTIVGVKSLDDVRRASVASVDCIFVADTFFEANAQSLAKKVSPDASCSTKRHACLEEVLDILSQT